MPLKISYNFKDAGITFIIFLRAQYPSLVTLNGVHNHSVHNVSALKELPVPDRIKDMFYTYFELGMY